MSEKTDKGYWETSAAKINMDYIDSQLFLADSVIDFLGNKNFIIAEKGIGKTLLLKKKKHDLLKEKSGGFFIPRGDSDLDIPEDFTSLSKNSIDFLEQVKYTKLLWSLSIQLSAIKIFYDKEEIISEYDKAKLPDIYNEVFTSGKKFSTPSEVFCALIDDIPKILQYNDNRKYYPIIDTSYKSINTPIYIFIDRLDQAMQIEKTNVPKKMWEAMQIGLLEAAWNLNEINSHIKTFCSIRKEAYNEYDSPVKANLSGKVCSLNYRKDELHKLVNKLVDFYEGRGKTIESIIGFENDGKFVHSKTGNEETVFSYILRHTLGKPRDLIRVAPALVMKINPTTDINNKVEELRTATNEIAKEIANDTFGEKKRFMYCLQDKTQRNKFLSLIPKNTLSQSTERNICKKFNKRKSECTREQCLNEGEGSCKHPFCDLYNIGLLGYVNPDDNIQIFKDPDADNTKHIPGNYSYYIIHPSLYKLIEEQRANLIGKNYIVTPGITTGNGNKWNKREAEISELIDFVLNSELPKEKEKEIMQKLKDDIKNTPEISQLDKEVKKIIRSMQKKIFLSYCWEDEKVVNKIDDKLRTLGLFVTRDKRDLKYKMNIKEYMKSLKEHDYVIPVISDSYLRSFNCMVEIGKLLEIDDYKTKTLQIILPNADIFDNKKMFTYNDYWHTEKEEIEKISKESLNALELDEKEKKIKEYDDIIGNLSKFLNFVKEERGMLLENFKKSGCQDLLLHINEKKEK